MKIRPSIIEVLHKHRDGKRNGEDDWSTATYIQESIIL